MSPGEHVREFYRRQGEQRERERIINLLKQRSKEWVGHDGACDCPAKATEDLDLVELIEGEQK